MNPALEHGKTSQDLPADGCDARECAFTDFLFESGLASMNFGGGFRSRCGNCHSSLEAAFTILHASLNKLGLAAARTEEKKGGAEEEDPLPIVLAGKVPNILRAHYYVAQTSFWWLDTALMGVSLER